MAHAASGLVAPGGENEGVAVPKQTNKRDSKKEKLFSAALKLIGERGYAGASVEEIASRAGVAKGVVYYYFDSKAHLAEQIIDTGLGILASRLSEVVSDELTPADNMRALIRQQLRLVERERDFAKFLLSEMWHDDAEWRGTLDARINDIVDIYLGIIARGQASGAFRTDINTDFVARTLPATILAGALNWTVVRPEMDLDTLTSEFTDYALAILAVPGDAGGPARTTKSA